MIETETGFSDSAEFPFRSFDIPEQQLGDTLAPPRDLSCNPIPIPIPPESSRT